VIAELTGLLTSFRAAAVCRSGQSENVNQAAHVVTAVWLEVSSDECRYRQVGVAWSTGEGKVNGKGKGDQ
jgi:hypothetical protein